MTARRVLQVTLNATFLFVVLASYRTEAFSIITTAPPLQNKAKSSLFGWNQRRQHVVLNVASSEESSSAPSAPSPVLNGKRVLPYKVMKGGLKGSQVAAVYALLNKEYKRG
jgi:hypothetical protein